MDKESAKNIITEYHLITKEKSREILKAIQLDRSIDSLNLPENINVHRIEELRLLYKEKKKEIETLYSEGTYPTNLPFYYILKEKYSAFSWEMLGAETNSNLINKISIETPRVKNLRLSLVSLLINDMSASIDTSWQDPYPSVRRLPSAIASSVLTLLDNLQALAPPPAMMENIVTWLQKGLRGEPLTLFSSVCPDYSVEKVEGTAYPYRYTFNELGSGIGLVAQRALEALPYLNEFFRKHDLNVTCVMAMGDFEALDHSNLKRVGLIREEFLSRVQKSINMIQENSTIPIQTFMLTDLCGGHASWNKHLRKFQKMFSKNNYGKACLDQKKILDIIKARKSLYDGWYGKHSHLEDYLPQLLKQGAEYAAMGAIIGKSYKDCLILGADHSIMGTFYNVEQSFPMIYLKRVYH